MCLGPNGYEYQRRLRERAHKASGVAEETPGTGQNRAASRRHRFVTAAVIALAALAGCVGVAMVSCAAPEIGQAIGGCTE